MRLRFAPFALLNPKLSFAAFLLVFFAPVVSLLSPEHALALACGVTAFYLGACSGRQHTKATWPECPSSWGVLTLILAAKLYLLAATLDYDFSLPSIVSALVLSSVAQKENVAGSILVNMVVNLILWLNLIGLCQRGRLYTALIVLLFFQLLSLQTGRFLLLSQMALLVMIHCDIHGKRINSAIAVMVLLGAAALFPLLHALRSGDIDTDVDVYSAEYIGDIMAADATPGRNFIELANHVDGGGYNYGKFLALAPLQVIPRFLWHEKPVTSLQAVYTKEIYGIEPLEGVTFTFTIFDSYSFFGAASIALVSLVWGRLFMLLYEACLRSAQPYMKIQLALLLVNAFNFFRGNVLDFAAPVVLSVIVAFVLDRLHRVRSNARHHKPLHRLAQAGES